jgi:predicted nucleotide-binding protein (sugar kinase/HSP70/actin superfamily)
MGHAQEKIFHGLLHTAQEATTAEILDHAAPHLDPSFRGEAILSVGKGLDMIERGACGIACAMPFGCMPGTVATSILRPLCEAHGVPFIAIPFDGAPSATSRLQLETFMEQAKQVLERRTRERGR